ncbi:MAG: MlrC C-terminal domain-containing protein, partial [Pseudomonadota bacterium]
SLDLHANISAAMVAGATQIAIFRTYPHLDMAATGARCLPMLLRQIAGERPAKAPRQVPFLVPLPAQFTGAEPCRGLYAALGGLPAGVTAEIALGFTAADTLDTGPAILAYAPDEATAERTADRLLGAFCAAEPRFDAGMLDPTEAVRQAMAAPRGPVVLADVQDNPGAGAPSDSTGLLAALVAAGAEGAVLALMADAEMAAKAHATGPGAIIEGALGGKSGLPGQRSFPGRFRVDALTDGTCVFTGEIYHGATAVLGPTAVLRVEDPRADVRVVVSSRRSQALDRAIFTHAGIDPAACRIVAVKSTVHYRADFDPIAAQTLSVAAPGGFPCELATILYRRLRPGLRLGPCGPAFAQAD